MIASRIVIVERKVTLDSEALHLSQGKISDIKGAQGEALRNFSRVLL